MAGSLFLTTFLPPLTSLDTATCVLPTNWNAALWHKAGPKLSGLLGLMAEASITGKRVAVRSTRGDGRALSVYKSMLVALQMSVPRMASAGVGGSGKLSSSEIRLGGTHVEGWHGWTKDVHSAAWSWGTSDALRRSFILAWAQGMCSMLMSRWKMPTSKARMKPHQKGMYDICGVACGMCPCSKTGPQEDAKAGMVQPMRTRRF